MDMIDATFQWLAENFAGAVAEDAENLLDYLAKTTDAESISAFQKTAAAHRKLAYQVAYMRKHRAKAKPAATAEEFVEHVLTELAVFFKKPKLTAHELEAARATRSSGGTPKDARETILGLRIKERKAQVAVGTAKEKNT